MEGVLIRGFEMKQGRRPEWNRNSGADIPYSDDDLAQAVDLLKAMAFLKSDHLHLTSHCAMIELSVNPKYVAFESFLHGVRLGTCLGSSIAETAEAMPDPYGMRYSQRIKESGSVRKLPQV